MKQQMFSKRYPTTVIKYEIELIQTNKQDQPAVHIPTNKEMREALRVLRLGVQNKSSEFELHYESFINDLLRKDMKQTKLDDFLNK